MKKSVFNASKFNKLTAVARGTKASNDIRPAITTGRAFNKFTMNASASNLLGAQHGDRLIMFVLPDAETINERFFVALSQNEDGAKLASAGNTKGVGRPQAFNYAGIWSQMVLMDKDTAPVGSAVLVDKGIMAEVETQKGRQGQQCTAILANKRVEYGLSLVEDENGDAIAVELDGVIYEKVYALVDPKELAVEENEETEEVEADAATEEEETL